ncbi:MAG: hypothetical protein RL120_07230, partial [Gammaproteobacteria bacterium]
MRSLKSALLILLLSIDCTVLAAESEADVARRFVGDYELISYVQYPPGGEPIENDYIGRLSYDRFGNMAGLGMPLDLPERAAQSSTRVLGGFAYWGTISIDTSEQKITHHVKGSPTAPQWVGGDNVRY